MQKILEYKNHDWMKGTSLQATSAVGGIFQTLQGCDPFEDTGFLKPSLSSTALTAPADNPTVITNYIGYNSTTPYFYVHTPTKLYQYLRNSPYTQTDKTSSIDVTNPVTGAIIWKNKYIYSQATQIRAWDFASSDIQLIAGGLASSADYKKMVIGPDSNLYVADFGAVSKITSETGTAGNTLRAFNIDTYYTVRDVLTDGTYLIILADNNTITTTNRTVGTYNCRVYFWDMDTTRTTSNRIWDIPDSYLIGGVYQDGAVHIWGKNGIYVCNYSSSPKMILDATGSTTIPNMPTNPYQISASSNTIYWGDATSNGQNILAYGSFPGQKNKIFYSPYITHGTTAKHTAIAYSAGAVIAGIDSAKLYMNNIGSTRGTATIWTVPTIMPQPYTLSHIKVVLKKPLASGDSVAVGAYDASSVIGTLMNITTQSYSSANPRKSLIFPYTPSSGSSPKFEDIFLEINLTGGAEISRIAVYATPLEDANT